MKDLGSSNGTVVNGHKLASNMSSSLLDGDMVKIGGVELTVRFVKERFFERERVTRAAMLASFFVTLLIYCLRPSVEFGLALVPWPLLAMIAIFAASAVLAGAVWTTLLKSMTWNMRLCRAFFAVVFVSTGMLSALVVWTVEPDIPLSEWVDGYRLEYFCVGSFEANSCRQTIADCPECAKHLLRWKQDILLKNMKLEREAFEQQIIKQIRSPASQ